MSGTQPNEKRRRKMYSITLDDDEVKRLDEIAARWGTNRSAAIARLVREATLPRPIG